MEGERMALSRKMGCDGGKSGADPLNFASLIWLLRLNVELANGKKPKTFQSLINHPCFVLPTTVVKTGVGKRRGDSHRIHRCILIQLFGEETMYQYWPPPTRALRNYRMNWQG